MGSNTQSGPTTYRDFLNEIRDTVGSVDLILILSVPLLLTIVLILPQSIQEILFLDYGKPDSFSLWGSSFVHRDFTHFRNNLVSYVVTIIPVYLFFAVANERRSFRFTFLGFLILLPPVIGLFNIAIIDQGSGAGFSGIASALFGFLPVSMLIFLQRKVSRNINPVHGIPLFLIAAGMIAVIYELIVFGTAVILISLIFTTIYVYEIGFQEFRNSIVELSSLKGYFELVFVATVLFLLSPFLLFPEEVVQNGSAVNIYSHYAGFTLGFFVPTIILTIRSMR